MSFIRFLDDRLEETVVVVLLAGMSLIIGLQVFMRYVMQESLSWSEEVARFMFIWLIYIGISYGVKTGRHIHIDVVFNMLPVRVGRWLAVLADLLFFGFAAFIAWKGAEVVRGIVLSGQSSAAVELPMWVVYSAAPTGFTLVMFRLAQGLWIKLREIRNNA